VETSGVGYKDQTVNVVGDAVGVGGVVCFENQLEHINERREQNVDCSSVKAYDIYSNQWALKG
jgi:hypothetical protein